MNRKKNLTKIDIAKTINKKKGLSVLISKKILDQYLEILTRSIIKRDFSIKNIGTFRIKFKEQRLGRNPKTKKEHIISARKSLKFIASKNLLNKLNSKCG